MPLFFGEERFFRGMGFALIDDEAMWHKRFVAEPEQIIVTIQRPRCMHGFWIITGELKDTPYRMCRRCDAFTDAEGKVDEVVDTLRDQGKPLPLEDKTKEE